MHLPGGFLSLQSTFELGTEFLLAWSDHVSSFLCLGRTASREDTHRRSRQTQEVVDRWGSELCEVFNGRSKPVLG